MPSFISSDGTDGFAPSRPSWQKLGRHYRPRPSDGTVDHTDSEFVCGMFELDAVSIAILEFGITILSVPRPPDQEDASMVALQLYLTHLL